MQLFKIVKEWQSLPSAEIAAKKVRQQRAARAAAEAAAAQRAAERAARQVLSCDKWTRHIRGQ